LNILKVQQTYSTLVLLPKEEDRASAPTPTTTTILRFYL